MNAIVPEDKYVDLLTLIHKLELQLHKVAENNITLVEKLDNISSVMTDVFEEIQEQKEKLYDYDDIKENVEDHETRISEIEEQLSDMESERKFLEKWKGFFGRHWWKFIAFLIPVLGAGLELYVYFNNIIPGK